ncbi:ArsR/SmtB family transcription factor [Microbacterium atlanticum]|uniref:ArsR/SmtB family transcription factor n=1 Tax=Microbacterium atlanticum TaxID=2782168 RepID=UPI0018896C7E|nr:metalloregulator ArsR/SmtB family transcription factor [Microbacterium atlanticum]
MHPFEALADPVRRRIVDILASGEHTAGQLADVVGREFRISRTAVSKHVRLLRDAGYVDGRAEENWRWYRLTAEGLESLEHAVSDIRAKYASAIGWDADARRFRDPLAHLPQYPSVPFRGPGRPSQRGRRGIQTSFVDRGSPDDEAPVPPPIYVPYSPPRPWRADAPRLNA